jgi:thioredoxin reductase (NADPH)
MASGKWDYDAVVIGGGPGGLVSGLYLGRFRRKVAVINSGIPRAAWIPKSHNLMGFPQGVSGRGILARLGRHLTQLKNVDRITGNATLRRCSGGFDVHVGGIVLKAHKAIVATGFQDRQPEISNLLLLRKLGVMRYCAICDAYDFKNQVLGALVHDSESLAHALFLAWYTPHLRIFIPQDMHLGARSIHEIKYVRAKVYRGKVTGIEPEPSRGGVLVDLERGQRVFCNVVYPFLGCIVNDYAFQHLKGLARTKTGFLSVTTEQRTNIPGLFAVGDCVNQVGQLSIAAGQAAVAATTIHNDLLDF